MDSSSYSPSTSIQSLKSDDDDHDATTSQYENELISESRSTGSVILEKQEQNTDDDEAKELNDKNEIEKESPLNWGDDKNTENDQNKNVNFKRNRKFSQMRVQDDQEIRANIRIRTPSQSSKERRTSLL